MCGDTEPSEEGGELVDELALGTDLGPGHRAVVGDVGQGLVAGLAVLHQHAHRHRAGAPDAGTAVDEHVAAVGEAPSDLGQQRAQVVEGRRVEVGDREPQGAVVPSWRRSQSTYPG